MAADRLGRQRTVSVRSHEDGSDTAEARPSRVKPLVGSLRRNIVKNEEEDDDNIEKT